MRYTNGILYVPVFEPTETVGTYNITAATYTNQADSTGLGAAAIEVGFVIYVQASDTNTFLPIPGRAHRYRITAVTVVDASTVNLTVAWDESLPIEDAPTNGADCIISSVSPTHKYGFSVGSDVYSSLNAGLVSGMLNTDIANITDSAVGGGGVSSINSKTGAVSISGGANVEVDNTGPAISISVTLLSEGTF